MELEIRKMIEPILKENNYILDDVIYEKENGTYFLRVIIDKLEDYITILDCVKVNELLDPILENQTILTDSYVLDVCSKEKGSV